MTNFTDDGEIDYPEEKQKNDDVQIRIAQLNAETELKKSRMTQVGVIVAALIALVGALFPTNSADEPYTPVAVAFAVAISGGAEQTPTPNPVEVVVASPEASITPNAVETSVSETLTAIVTSSTISPTITLEPSVTSTLPPIATDAATATGSSTNTPRPPSSTPSPVLIETIEVLGNSNTGAQFTVPQTGRYAFRFNSGGYCTYGADPGFANYLPTIWVFENTNNFWEDDGRTLNQNIASRIIAPVSDCGAGNNAYCNTIEDAEVWGLRSSEVRMNLTEGTTLTLIGVDHREAYIDNPGQVLIDILLLPD
jgi:hypothetical protein